MKDRTLAIRTVCIKFEHTPVCASVSPSYCRFYSKISHNVLVCTTKNQSVTNQMFDCIRICLEVFPVFSGSILLEHLMKGGFDNVSTKDYCILFVHAFEGFLLRDFTRYMIFSAKRSDIQEEKATFNSTYF